MKYEQFALTLGLIWKIQNPDILKLCLETLDELRQGIEAHGFNEKHNDWLLKRIYGDPDRPHLQRTLYYLYLRYLDTKKLTDEERARGKYATPARCKEKMLIDIDAEIGRLKQYQEKHESIESERRAVEILRQRVPDSRGMHSLLAYEVHLGREYARTAAELEHSQRVRMGHPVPPTLKVELS